MPEIVNCPSCNRKLQVPENFLGQQVQCPSCAATFVASAGSPERQSPAPPPLPPSDPYRPAGSSPPEPYEPAQRRRRYEDDDYGEDDDAYRPRRRRDMMPHRGPMILTLGILSLVVCGPILGPIAWILGNTDMREIRSGRMDPEGEGITNAGRICGMVGTILSLTIITFYCLFVLLAVGLGGGGAFR